VEANRFEFSGNKKDYPCEMRLRSFFLHGLKRAAHAGRAAHPWMKMAPLLGQGGAGSSQRLLPGWFESQ